MNPKEFEFAIAQVENVIGRCRKSFPKKSHQETYDNLIELFHAIKSYYSSLTTNILTNSDIDNLVFCRTTLLYLIYVSIEFLDYKSLKDSPAHHTFCLEIALKDWIGNPNNFSIVFSNNNSLGEFYHLILSEKKIKEINIRCNQLFNGLSYKHGLIHISQSSFFKDDYLSSIPIYHELGHFIDENYSISYEARREVEKAKYKFNNAKVYFNQLETYFAEHFADLFAAQYLGNAMAESLNYYALDDKDSKDHPSTEFRIRVINAFLTGYGEIEEMDIVNRLKQTTIIQTSRKDKKELKNRLLTLTKDPFSINKPVIINNPEEVHSLYSLGWKYFMESPKYAKYNPIKRLK